MTPDGLFVFHSLAQTLETDTNIEGQESSLMVSIPQFDAIIGNFPIYQRRSDERREKGILKKLPIGWPKNGSRYIRTVQIFIKDRSASASCPA